MFEGLGVQRPDNEDFIKRVIGLPGDTVVGQGRARCSSTASDSTSRTSRRTTADFDEITVPDGMLFVHG